LNGNAECSTSATSVTSFKVNPSTGALTSAGTPVTTTDDNCGTVFIGADPASRFVYVPLSNTDQVAVYSVNQSTGVLTAVSGSPFNTGDYPFHAKTDMTGNLLFVTNYNDETLSVFTVAASGSLTAVGSAIPLSGFPHLMMIDPQNKFLYVPNESGSIDAFAISASGTLTAVAGSPFSDPNNNGSEVYGGTVSLDGRFLIATNRDDLSVSVFAVNQNTGALTPVSGSPFASGDIPFTAVVAVSGGNTYVAVNAIDDADVWVYQLNTSTGALTAVSGSPFTLNSWSWPHYIAVDTSGKFGYVVNHDFSSTSNITAVTIGANGTLTQVSGSPFSTDLNLPINMVITH
jgi:6-phosphogluconolactonase (cycloisomerase 2 family)